MLNPGDRNNNRMRKRTIGRSPGVEGGRDKNGEVVDVRGKKKNSFCYNNAIKKHCFSLFRTNYREETKQKLKAGIKNNNNDNKKKQKLDFPYPKHRGIRFFILKNNFFFL